MKLSKSNLKLMKTILNLYKMKDKIIKVQPKLNERHLTAWDNMHDVKGWCEANKIKIINETPNKIITDEFFTDEQCKVFLIYELKGNNVFLTEVSRIKDQKTLGEMNDLKEPYERRMK